VVNLLRVPGEQQVMLKVTVAEVNRAAARSIGVNFSIRNNAGVTVFAQTTGNILGSTTGGTTAGGITSGVGSAANLIGVIDQGKIALAINALRTLDFARTLAEPNLTTLNGQPANFRAGGEFPVPVVTGFTAAGLQGVSFVPFGVQLSFTPFITDKDRVRLLVSADVSTKDLSSSANVNGTAVPGLNSRTFTTTVELREGQTLAVAGLIQTNFGADATRVPFFGDLPIIGRLAAFDRTSAGEQELVVLVTPELVHPLEPKECPPLPGSDVFEPGDLEFYLLGRLESRRSYDYRSPVRTDIHRMIRYRHCEQLFINGPSGHSDGKP
jgi:pilus assembly protein CpaC